MPQEPDIHATFVLLIDASKNQRTYWADQLKRCSADYEILEASDGESGLALCLSRRLIASCSNSHSRRNRASKYS
jgi:hypothetical protein